MVHTYALYVSTTVGTKKLEKRFLLIRHVLLSKLTEYWFGRVVWSHDFQEFWSQETKYFGLRILWQIFNRRLEDQGLTSKGLILLPHSISRYQRNVTEHMIGETSAQLSQAILCKPIQIHPWLSMDIYHVEIRTDILIFYELNLITH